MSIKCNNAAKVEATDTAECAPAATVDTKISSDNKGFKMMKMLGWTGGALGSAGAGIEEPITVQVKVDRKGLGLPSAGSAGADSNTNSNLNRSYFHKYLSGYQSDESSVHELVFSKDFTKEERKILHE